MNKIDSFRLNLKNKWKNLKGKTMKQPDWNKTNLTFGEALGNAMKVQTQKEADVYFKNLVEYQIKKDRCSKETAIENSLRNIRYFTGYYTVDIGVGNLMELFHKVNLLETTNE